MTQVLKRRKWRLKRLSQLLQLHLDQLPRKTYNLQLTAKRWIDDVKETTKQREINNR